VPGLTNGGAPWRHNNNLPVASPTASTLTSAAADAATGIPAGTLDQITHADINVSSHDCNFCHTQRASRQLPACKAGNGRSRVPRELHVCEPTGEIRHDGACSNCHITSNPRDVFTAFDHSAFSATPGPGLQLVPLVAGTATATAANWLWSCRNSRDRDIDELGLRFPDFKYRYLRASKPEHLYELCACHAAPIIRTSSISTMTG